jgi:putative hydrolase of the HAD superfamily
VQPEPERDDAVKALIWDFDGTLASRQGGRWTGALLEVIQRAAPGAGTTDEEIRPFLQSGFPWLTPDQPHPNIQTADQWWQALLPVFAGAFRGVGFGASEARNLAAQVRPVYADPARWCLYDDVLPTLARLSACGWSHLILSNHVPELRNIVRALGLLPYFQIILSSAEIGYEKPHPRAFQAALAAVPEAAALWMIGDSPNADVAGAQAMGIPAILVRSHDADTEYTCESLACVPAIIEASGKNSMEVE